MAEAQRITEPVSFQCYNVAVQRRHRTIRQAIRIKIAHPASYATSTTLLKPPAQADMLTGCRDSDSRLTRSANGVVYGPFEYLDTRPLSAAWRHALVTVLPIP